jgi:hypothetical protein
LRCISILDKLLKNIFNSSQTSLDTCSIAIRWRVLVVKVILAGTFGPSPKTIVTCRIPCDSVRAANLTPLTFPAALRAFAHLPSLDRWPFFVNALTLSHINPQGCDAICGACLRVQVST